MRALISHPRWDDADLSSLRMMACGSSTIPQALLQAFAARGIPPAQVYGSTETGPIAVYQSAESAMQKLGCAGKPGLHSKIRIVDSQSNDVPVNELGEILVRGPNIMAEYWGQAEATQEALRDGWFFTGDIGRIDEEGDLWVTDRKKDVVISGGENIYPAELERVLEASSLIREAAIVGRPDGNWGEVPVAFIVPECPSLTSEQVLSILGKEIAPFKHPKEIYFRSSLPRNVMGKLQKAQMREKLISGNIDIG